MAQPLKYELTEEDLKKMVNGVLFHLKETFDNPFTMSKDVRNRMLSEGLIMTYPAEEVEKYLKKRYGKYAFVERYENSNKIEIFRIGFYNDEDSKSVVNNDMALCGYFPSHTDITPDGSTMYVTYEPKYQDSITDKVQNEEHIYHLTKTSKAKKILRIGLTPKTNNKKFSYPDRVYFFLAKPDNDNCLFLMKQFYDAEKNGGIEKPYEGSYTLLKINTERVKNCTFYDDPNAEDCVYTYDNIPPTAIEVVCEFEQEYIK